MIASPERSPLLEKLFRQRDPLPALKARAWRAGGGGHGAPRGALRLAGLARSTVSLAKYRYLHTF